MFLEKAGGQGPETLAWLDGAAAQQDLALMRDHRSDHDLGIAVIDMAAIAADVPLHCVSVRHTAFEARTGRGRRRRMFFGHARKVCLTCA